MRGVSWIPSGPLLQAWVCPKCGHRATRVCSRVVCTECTWDGPREVTAIVEDEPTPPLHIRDVERARARAVVAHVQQHPGCGTGSIARALRIPIATVRGICYRVPEIEVRPNERGHLRCWPIAAQAETA